VRLILAMDVPALVEIGRVHPDDAYRRALGIFTRELWDRAGASLPPLDDSVSTALAAARRW
jgi:CDP-glycerol glycerophosphotransferase